MQAPAAPVYPAHTRVERALDVLFPPRCVGCRRYGRWICPDCWRAVMWIAPNVSWPLPAGSPLTDLRAPAVFSGPAREAVHALKYEGRHAIRGMMGRLMAEQARDLEVDLVAPLPLHRSRRRERGYDQAALLAREVARALDLPCHPGLIRRVRKTRQQTSLDAVARQENVRGAFRVSKPVEARSVLLIDDVFTTGATMGEAARQLRCTGVDSVYGLVFARADHPDLAPEAFT